MYLKQKLISVIEKIKGTGLAGQLIRRSMGVGAVKLLAIPLSLLVSVILARSLGPQKFGYYNFVISFVLLLSIPVSGGLPQLLTREIARFVHSSDWNLYKGILKWANQWVFWFSIIVVLLFFILLFLNVLPDTEKWMYLSVGIFLIPAKGFGAIRRGVLRGLGYASASQIDIIVRPVASIVFLMVFLGLGQLSTETALLSQVFSAAIVFIVGTLLLKKVSPIEIKPSLKGGKSNLWLRAMMPFTLLSLISTLNAEIGILLLGFLHEPESVAAMRVAERGAQFVAMPLTIVNIVIAPYIVRAFHDQNKVQLRLLLKKTARIAFLIATPICVLMLFFGRQIVGFVFGDAYSIIAYTPLAILAIAQLVNVVFGSVALMLSMSGHEKDTVFGLSVGFFVSLMISALLIPSYGAIGAAVGVSLGLVLLNVFLAYRVFKRIGIRTSAF